MSAQHTRTNVQAGNPLSFHWFLPTYGDSRDLVAGGHGSSMHGTRDADLGYLKQVAAAAEWAGFDAVLTPTGAWCEDAWLTTAMLVDSTERLRFLVAARPGLVSPTLLAQMAATFQWQSGGRLLLNVVTGGESAEQRSYGDFLDKDARYARTTEFLTVVRRLWTSPEPVSFRGDHLEVEGAIIGRRPEPLPPVFFGGSSAAGLASAAATADTYLTWGERPADVAAKLSRVDELAGEHGRTLTHGIRFHVITRDTTDQAWAEAERLLRGLDPADIQRVQATLGASESEGQRRMRELHGGSVSELEIHPNVWAGVGLVRGGAGTAIVGSHTEVADRICDYASLGLDHFILSGYPHLEEAFRFGEGVLPILADRGVWTPPVVRTGVGSRVPFAFGRAGTGAAGPPTRVAAS